MPIGVTDAQEPKKKSGLGILHKVGMPLIAAGQFADAKTTIDALKRPGTQEANGMMKSIVGNSAALYGTKAAVAAGEMYGLHKLGKNHPKLATGLSIALGALPLAVAASNRTKGR